MHRLINKNGISTAISSQKREAFVQIKLGQGHTESQINRAESVYLEKEHQRQQTRFREKNR
jgi:NCAIR mutase (PurE)-related protein